MKLQEYKSIFNEQNRLYVDLRGLKNNEIKKAIDLIKNQNNINVDESDKGLIITSKDFPYRLSDLKLKLDKILPYGFTNIE